MPNISKIKIKGVDYTIYDSTIKERCRMEYFYGTQMLYNGNAGNIITQGQTINDALKAIDDAIGNVETLLANI